MKILVDEMPDSPADCIESYRYFDYSLDGYAYVCTRSEDEFTCDKVEDCPYYKAVSEKGY